MKIGVRYMAQLRRAAGTAVEQDELDSSCSAADLVKRVAARHGQTFRDLVLDAEGGVQAAVLLFVGEEQVGLESGPLRDGDVVTVLTPMAGG